MRIYLAYILYNFNIKKGMYKPKSPVAANKSINLSPSPQSKRRVNNNKTHI